MQSHKGILKTFKSPLHVPSLTLLFVDDILIFCESRKIFPDNLKDILNTFFLSTGMKINLDKSSLMAWGLSDLESLDITSLFVVQLKIPTEGLKYICFTLKASGYSLRK
jgi:hypothetical protein